MNTKETKESQSSRIYPIQFSYQKGERYEPLINKGLVENLEESDLCWLACIDMAVSTRLPNSEERLEFIFDLAKKVKRLNLLSANGGINIGDKQEHEVEFLEILNNCLVNRNIPLELIPKSLNDPKDITDELIQGNLLLIVVYNKNDYGHMLLSDKLFLDREGDEGVISTWNPIAPSRNALYAREFNDISQLYFLAQGRPNKIASNAYVFRQLMK